MANPRTCELFGYNEGDVIGLKVEDLIPQAIRSRHVGLRTDFHQSPKKRSMGAGMNLKACRKDGTEFYVEISLNHMSLSGETYISATVHNVTVLLNSWGYQPLPLPKELG